MEDIHSNKLLSNYFEELRKANRKNISRINNVDIFYSSKDEKYLSYCHLPSFLPLTRVNYNNIPTSFVQDIKGLIAILLATQHLNTGDGSVIPQLTNLSQSCNVRFTAEFFDTEFMEYKAISQLLQVFSRENEFSSQPESLESQMAMPCSFLGPYRTSVSIPMAINTGASGYPQLSHMVTGNQLNEKLQFQLFARVIPSDHGTAQVLIKYLHNVLGITCLAVVHTTDSFGFGFISSLRRAVTAAAVVDDSGSISLSDFVIKSVPIPYQNPTLTQIKNVIDTLVQMEFRYFFGVLTNEIYNPFMTEAYKAGIAGPGITWIFADTLNFETITQQDFTPDSILHNATIGTSVLKATGNISGTPVFDAFSKAFYELENSPQNIDYIESKLPPNFKHSLRWNEIFDSQSDMTDASLLYDATIATGLGACHAAIHNKTRNITQFNISHYFTGKEHYHSILNTSFIGASGMILFDSHTGTRKSLSANYQLTNFQIENSNHMTKFKAVPIGTTSQGKWNIFSQYIYADGTTNIPPGLIEIEVNYNYIGTGMRAFGLLLCAILMLTSIFFTWWTHHNRNEKVVLISNVAFLYCICLGAFIMVSAIIPLSLDDEIVSQHSASIACKATIWIFSTGISFSFGALFSKIWRLYQLKNSNSNSQDSHSAEQEENENSLHTRQNMRPILTFLTFNYFILTLWTIISPRNWHRIPLEYDIHNRILSSQGCCASKNDLAFYSVFALVDTIMLALALYKAYKVRKMKTPLGDTSAITLTIGGVMLVLALGIPIQIIVHDQPQAIYFVQMFTATSISALVLIGTFYPRVKFHKELKYGDGSIIGAVRRTRQSIIRRASSSM